MNAEMKVVDWADVGALARSDFLGLIEISHRTVRWANDALHRLFGYEQNELLQQPLRQLFNDEGHYESFVEVVFPLIERGGVFREEYPLRRKDGSVGWFHINFSLLAGQTHIAVGALIDISKRRAAVQEQEARLAEVLHASMDAIVSVDALHRIVHFNPAAEALFLRSAEEMLGRPLGALLPERLRLAHGQHMEAFLTSGGTGRRMGALGEITGLRADGKELRLEASISRSDHQGQPVLTAFLRDITERKAAIEAVEQGRTQLEAALMAMSDAVLITDVEGRCLHCNPAFATRHECTVQEEGASTSYSLSEFDSGQSQPIARALGGETGRGVEYRLSRSDTGEAWVGSYNFAPIRTGDGTLLGAVVTARDVTAQKHAEQTLRDSQAQIRAYAQRLDKAIESERTHVAREIHDVLGQILTAQKMDLAAVSRCVKPGLTEKETIEVKKRLAEVVELTDELLHTVRRLAGELRPPVLRQMGLEQVIRVQCEKFSARTGIPCCAVNVQALRLHEARALSVYRILQEALTNIARHDPKARHVRVRLQEHDEDFLLEIVNHGRIISTEEASDPRAFGLTGMRERAIAMGGVCTVVGLPDEGTLVRLQAPMKGDEKWGRASAAS